MNVEELNQLIDNLHWDIPEETRDKSKKKLLLVDDDKLELLIMPRGKPYWDGAAEVLRNIGYPRLRSVLPALLVWLQDLNWPGSQSIAELLLSVGQPMIPYVKEVLKGTDIGWQYWVLEVLIKKWPSEIVAEFGDELKRLTGERDSEEVYLMAREILLQNNLLGTDS